MKTTLASAFALSVLAGTANIGFAADAGSSSKDGGLKQNGVMNQQSPGTPDIINQNQSGKVTGSTMNGTSGETTGSINSNSDNTSGNLDTNCNAQSGGVSTDCTTSPSNDTAKP